MKISARSMYQGQSHYIDVAQGAIFMDQNMRFGLILGNTEKKNLADYEQLLRPVFSCVCGQKKLYLKKKHCSVYARNLKFFF